MGYTPLFYFRDLKFSWLSILLLQVVLCANTTPVFSYDADKNDSTDLAINDALDNIYDELYFVDYDRAATAIDHQTKLAQQSGRWHLVISALMLKAQCAYNHYLADKTYEALLTAEVIAEKYRQALDTLDPVMIYRSEINYTRGMHFHELGDFSRAILSFEGIVENERKYHGLKPAYLQAVHSFIGHSYLQLLMYDKGFLNYEQSSVYLKSLTGQRRGYQHAMLELLKGQCREYKAQQLGDTSMMREALRTYKHALTTLLTGKDDVSYQGALTSAYARAAAVYTAMGNFDSASYALNASLNYQKKNDPIRSQTYITMGDLYAKQEMSDKALAFYDKSIAIAERSYRGKHFRKSVPLFKKAALLLALDRDEDALYTCQSGLIQLVPGFDNIVDQNSIPSLQSNDVQCDIKLLLDGLSLKGKIHFFRYDRHRDPKELQTSLECYAKAIDVIREAQKRYPEAEYKQNLAAKEQSLYEDALEATFASFGEKSGDTTRASMLFRLFESNKSNMLRGATRDAHVNHFLGVPSTILENESYLKGSIASGRAKLYQNPNDTLTQQWKKDLYKVSREYDSLVLKIRRDYPDYYDIKYGNDILPMDKVTDALGPGTVLVEYFWGERFLFVFGMSRQKFVIKKIDLDKTRIQRITRLLDIIKKGDLDKADKQTSEFKETSYSVYKEILEPVLIEWPDGEIKSLAIVPDGLLNYLPFDILLTAQSNSKNYYDQPFLLRKYAARNLFSASTLNAVTNNKKYTSQYVGFAPDYGSQITIDSTQSHMTSFGQLNYNVDEVSFASEYFGGRIYTGREATEDKFRSVSGRAKLMHLSMHGFVNNDDPSFSAMIFTRGDTLNGRGYDHDGLLYLHELYDLPLNSDLAVLSACETGGGRYTRGEGIVSLGKAFRYAGCENIVMSLWKVNDRTTAQLMQIFFRHLSAGMNKDEALRQAKLSFLSDPKNRHFTHPYYWSGFILSGDALPLLGQKIPMYIYFAIGSVCIFLTTVFVWYRKSKSSQKGAL
ncbi:MAG TPA: CHAT domain-containing tetratricopeptide repeat protein [Chryseolinea sp.]|nr:CHAT domain-containing tetratricopeptide repeat protein [Chryseolinea sp.]